jgi:cytochrome d ubiquinol oxidase subunit I
MEGHFETQRGQPLILSAGPTCSPRRRATPSRCRRLGSYILTHDWNGEVKGLKAWPRAERPNSPIVFWSFRIMVGVGVLMVLLGPVSLAARARGACTTAAAARFAVLMGRRASCRAGGLDHHRGRPPALYRLRPAAHRQIRSRRSTRQASAPRCWPSSSSTSPCSAPAPSTSCG